MCLKKAAVTPVFPTVPLPPPASTLGHVMPAMHDYRANLWPDPTNPARRFPRPMRRRQRGATCPPPGRPPSRHGPIWRGKRCRLFSTEILPASTRGCAVPADALNRTREAPQHRPAQNTPCRLPIGVHPRWSLDHADRSRRTNWRRSSMPLPSRPSWRPGAGVLGSGRARDHRLRAGVEHRRWTSRALRRLDRASWTMKDCIDE